MSFKVELENITKEYGAFKAVDNVTLQIAQGQIVTFLGPSGCGKTTTLRMVAGLLKPTSGVIRINGEDVTDVPPYKRDVAMVFQNYALFPHFTVFENVVFGLRNRKIKDMKILQKKAKEVLQLVQLENSEEKYPRQLSGGQQQRVSLARALIVNPRVMMFDEPLSNLDAKLREQTRVEIRTLLKEMNITAIYVTHDQEEALTISDCIAVMNKGRIEQVAAPRELYTKPATQFVVEFVGHTNIFYGQICEISDERVSVDCGLARPLICAKPVEELPAGKDVLVMVRPENMHISGSAHRPEADNAFKAKIKSKSFLGSIIRYEMSLENGACLEIDIHPLAEVAKDENNELIVFWDHTQCVLIQEERGGGEEIA